MRFLSLIFTFLVGISAVPDVPSKPFQPVHQLVYDVQQGKKSLEQECIYEYDENNMLIRATQRFPVSEKEIITEYKSDTTRRVGCPDDVQDSLEQAVSTNFLDHTRNCEEGDGLIIQEQLDFHGRVTQIDRITEEGYHWRYIWHYDELGRFSDFCYEDLRRRREEEQQNSFSFVPWFRMKGSFRYYEDGSRDCIEEIYHEDSMGVGTYHFNPKGFLTEKHGRSLYLGFLGYKEDVEYCYGAGGVFPKGVEWNADFSENGSFINSDFDVLIPYSKHQMYEPECWAQYPLRRIDMKQETNEDGNPIRVEYYFEDELYRIVEYEYA